MIIVKTEQGEILDLKPNQDISLSIENPLMTGDRIPIAWSTDFELAPTIKNFRIFEFVAGTFSPPRLSVVNVEIYANGIAIASGKLNFTEVTAESFSVSFSGASIENSLSGMLHEATMTKFNFGTMESRHELLRYSHTMSDAQRNKRPEFTIPPLLRESKRDVVDIYFDLQTDPTRLSWAQKFTNSVEGGKFIVPVLKLKYILECIFPECKTPAIFQAIIEQIGIVGQYRENGLVEDYEHGGLDKDESGNYVLDLANTLPSTSCVDFVKDILNALCATIFISPLGIEIVDNKSTVLSGDFIDWTSRIDDHHTIQWEQGQGYECGYAGISEPEEIEEPVSISSNMEGCFDAANLTMVKHLYTDDIYKRTTATVKFGDSSKAPIVRDIPLLSTCRQGRMFVPELAQTDRDVYSAKSNLTPVTTQPIVHYVEYTSSSLLKYRYVAPIIAIPEVGGSRPTDVYFGMLHQNRVPPGGVGSQAPYLQMSTNGVIGGNGWTGAWQGLWEEREESFTMTGSGGIYETFHKDFAEWLAIDKTIFQFELNLTAQDIYNLQLWRKVMLRNKLFFIKNLNITLNTSNSSITTEGEFVKAETL